MNWRARFDTPRFGLAAAALGAVGFAFGPIFGVVMLERGLSPEATAFWRYMVPAALLAPAMARARRHGRQTGGLFAAGMLVGVGMAFYFQALDRLGVAAASVIYYVYPALTLLIGWLFFDGGMGVRRWLAALLVLAGAVAAIDPAGLAGADAGAAALCLLAPLAFAVLLNVIAALAPGLPFGLQIAPVLWGCVTALLPMALAAPGGFWPDDMRLWGLVVGIGCVSMLLPAALATFALTRTGAAPVGVVSALELPLALAAGVALLGQDVGGRALVGAAVIVAAAILASVSHRTQPPTGPR